MQRSVLIFPLGLVTMIVAGMANLATGSIGPCGARPNGLLILLLPAYPALGLAGILDTNGWCILFAALGIGAYDYALLFSIAYELLLWIRRRKRA